MRMNRVPVCVSRPARSIVRVKASAEVSAPVTCTPEQRQKLIGELKETYAAYDKAPPSQKFEFSGDVLAAYQAAKAGGALAKWGAWTEAPLARRTVMQGELRQVGIKQPGMIAVPSTRNDAAFLATVVVSTSLTAVLAGAVLPGDWGFFSSYLIGSISFVVLGIGSTQPGLLQFFIDKFSQVYPDYRARVIRHEAAHLLAGYLVGCPITSYSVEVNRERVEFAEARLQKRLIERTLTDAEIDSLAIMAVAGIAAEGQQYEEVLGQTADLMDLQRIMLRASTAMSNQQQQNMTRWAVFAAGSLLRQYKKEHESVIEAMSRGASVMECVDAIEAVKRD
eukprot:CAMPEP_0202868502 /NCGR_PEP_ID=MMETSP1391-20130828/10913_1 /ASSEMBLY_ACC=CAM_ASM_000867 /TAXON_ID=1034604 /ORGANISM="Chlamydomonas leiostraca, Strain SAG 11-49" /LENGTH=335 /DNA_ID=CAMNT_0049548681 /DNA_START=69 /DNA_END=1076 /DNA_ORIENTATION=-